MEGVRGGEEVKVWWFWLGFAFGLFWFSSVFFSMRLGSQMEPHLEFDRSSFVLLGCFTNFSFAVDQSTHDMRYA